METQDVKMGRINLLKDTMLSDQTALLLLMHKLSTRLEEQASTSKEHSERFEKLESLMTSVLKELIAIKEILASTGDVEFVPESDDEG